ncbi:hypothetical protein JTB14_009544 [Gonioctena quinquepunctata]|nr:hypothetical protein JTB14_009544 [Gonioctena quinquepunctata]
MTKIVSESIYNQNIERLTEENKEELNRLKSKTENNAEYLKSLVKKKKTESFPALASRNNEQKFLRKTANIQPPQKDNKAIETSNRYDLLPSEEMEIPTEEHTEEISRTMNKTKGKVQTPVASSKQKIPPIVIKGKLISQSTAAALRKTIEGRQFIIEHKRYNTMIYAKSNEDRIRIMRSLETAKYQFHTYTWKEEKTHAFILKGLDQEPTTDEIKTALMEEYKLDAQKVFRFGTYNAIYMLGKEKIRFESKLDQPKVDQRREKRPTLREEDQWRSTPPMVPHLSQCRNGSNGPRGPTGENSKNYFEALASRVTELNSLINVPKMIREYDILIDRIKKANSDTSKMMVLLNFVGENGGWF